MGAVRSNQGAAGVDGQTLSTIEQEGVDSFLLDIQRRLQSGTQLAATGEAPADTLNRTEPSGRWVSPTVRDRVVQAATKIVVEPIFEADFKASSYGFRPKKSATAALEAIRLAGGAATGDVVEIDIEKFRDSIDHDKLMLLVEQRIGLVGAEAPAAAAEAGVLEDGRVEGTDLGSPQGRGDPPASWVNTAPGHVLDRLWNARAVTSANWRGEVRPRHAALAVLAEPRADAEHSLLRLGRTPWTGSA